MFLCGFCCFNGIVIITLNSLYRIRMYALDGGDHGKLPWSGFGCDDSHPYAYTEAKYTGILPVLFNEYVPEVANVVLSPVNFLNAGSGLNWEAHFIYED